MIDIGLSKMALAVAIAPLPARMPRTVSDICCCILIRPRIRWPISSSRSTTMRFDRLPAAIWSKWPTACRSGRRMARSRRSAENTISAAAASSTITKPFWKPENLAPREAQVTEQTELLAACEHLGAEARGNRCTADIANGQPVSGGYESFTIQCLKGSIR